MQPMIADFAYGPHERHRIDVYRPEVDGPVPFYFYTHGGGFRSGDKSGIYEGMRDRLLDAGIAIVAANYRLSDSAKYPGAMVDAARALQTARANADEWGLDKTRVAGGGGSAGSGIGFWLGFGPERARPESDDAIERESTRLNAIASWQAQSSYDPRFVRTIISGQAWRHPVLETFFGIECFEDEASPEAQRVFDEVNFIAHATVDSPPVFLWYKTRDLPMTDDLELGPGIHHPKFGMVLKERLDALGVECQLHLREERPDLEDEMALLPYFLDHMTAFLRRHLRPGT